MILRYQTITGYEFTNFSLKVYTKSSPNGSFSYIKQAQISADKLNVAQMIEFVFDKIKYGE